MPAWSSCVGQAPRSAWIPGVYKLKSSKMSWNPAKRANDDKIFLSTDVLTLSWYLAPNIAPILAARVERRAVAGSWLRIQHRYPPVIAAASGRGYRALVSAESIGFLCESFKRPRFPDIHETIDLQGEPHDPDRGKLLVLDAQDVLQHERGASRAPVPPRRRAILLLVVCRHDPTGDSCKGD